MMRKQLKMVEEYDDDYNSIDKQSFYSFNECSVWLDFLLVIRKCLRQCNVSVLDR